MVCSLLLPAKSFTSFSFSVRNCSHGKSAAVFAYDLRTHLAVSLPEAVRGKARCYLCEPTLFSEIFSIVFFYKVIQFFNSLASFQHISFTCLLKLFERIILFHIRLFLEFLTFFGSDQFYPGRFAFDPISFFVLVHLKRLTNPSGFLK